MTKFFTEHNQFSLKHFGFRANMSCADAACELTDYVKQEFDKYSKGYCFFVDLKRSI